MSAAPKLDPLADTNRLDVAADQAIAACDGDVRAAIRALIMANEYLEMELSEVYAAVSRGYTRGDVWRPPHIPEKTVDEVMEEDPNVLPSQVRDWCD
jgi:hypothetical protein